ncbi:uncharacterized protein LOC124208570 [Daphnia pulex]|uniref:uncharacterized protein LOC124208570 n=1 Tax=Daphnia pulex TaxID=6669 RepID=UPI001EDD3A3A|nr:uncharacterized protein LOC124208570 [Daphnia pulex]
MFGGYLKRGPPPLTCHSTSSFFVTFRSTSCKNMNLKLSLPSLVLLVSCCIAFVTAAPSKSRYASEYEFATSTLKRLHNFDPLPPIKHNSATRYYFNKNDADSQVNKYNADKQRMCILRDNKYSRVGCNFLYVVFTHPPVYRILAESIALYRVILDNLV